MGLRLLLAGVGAVLAGCLVWASFSFHLQRACVLNDTPYLPLCPDTTALAREDLEQALRKRISRNPGDSSAWISLAAQEFESRRRGSLGAAAALAANEPNVLQLRAAEALERNDLEPATALLVQLITRYGGAEAPKVLAQLIATGQGIALLRPHISDAKRWLPQVLWALGNLKLPAPLAMPLVAEAAAQKTLTPAAIQGYIRALKAGGYWGDAYALWISQIKERVPLVYNGSFDKLFEPDGFDWEVTPVQPSRAGALAVQRDLAKRGKVLEIEFSGRPMAVPIVRQYLFVAPGRYAVRGQYVASKLKTEQGLAWAVRCPNAARTEAGRSDALQDTSGAWKSFQFEFTLPAQCGLVASLQLEPFAPFEATAGFKGRATFDAIEVRPAGL